MALAVSRGYRSNLHLTALSFALVPAGQLPVATRLCLVSDLFALVREGALAVTDALAFLEHYSREGDYYVLSTLQTHLGGDSLEFMILIIS
jgi:hypothetical protein